MDKKFQVDKAEHSATITRQRPEERNPTDPLQGAIPRSLRPNRPVTVSFTS